jgi:hypothetical protein
VTLLVWLAAGILAPGAAIMGITDNWPGLVLLHLAAAAVLLAFVHPWRSARNRRLRKASLTNQPRQ